MQVQEIVMDQETARRKLDAWLNEKHKDVADVREDCIKGYEALAAGQVLIDLGQAIRDAEVFASGFPKLAVARADQREVYFTWHAGDHHCTFTCDFQRRGGRPSPTLRRRIEMRRVHGQTWPNGNSRWLAGYAQVPLLPAEVRPEKGQLKDWFILWEVEQWYARPELVEPDRDPILLQHVAGQLYAILAEWDLTDLERAVMAGALRPDAEAR